MVEEKKTIKKNTKKKIKIINEPEKKEEKYTVRGNIFYGKVVSAKANKTVTVKRDLIKYLPKYERYKKTVSKIHAHNPNNIAKEGDLVKIGETRRLSKTKSFIVMEIINKNKE